MRRILLAVALCAASPLQAENFSCRIGTSAACLDYGDSICSSRGTCVDKDAACFDKYQCNYEGFTCKSNVTACANDYEELRKIGKDLSEKYDALVVDYNELQQAGKVLSDTYDEAQQCLTYATTLEAAKACMP